VPVEGVDFAPEAILEVLARHEVEFVLIGGLAAYIQGSAFVTEDVDITPKIDPDNYAKLSAALVELDAKVRAQNTEPLPFNHDARSLLDTAIWNLSTRFGDLDITATPSGTQGYEDLRRDAITIRVLGEAITVASLADVVRSKGTADRPKDRRTLPLLRELLAEKTIAAAESRRRTKG
jgi:hypothetical protein